MVSPPEFVPPLRRAAPDESWVLDYRRYTLGVAALFMFFDGVGQAFHGSRVTPLVALALGSTFGVYAALDARAFGKQYLRTFQWLLMWTWPVGLLVHLVWTRRWRGIGVYFAMLALGGLALAFGFGLGRLLAMR